MKIKLQRLDAGPDDTRGMLYIDGKLAAVTLEDESRLKKVKGETRIPAGIYHVSKRFSPKFKRFLLWLMHVPDFDYILIHAGNTEDHTDGCILVGKSFGVLNGKRAVLNSRSAESEVNEIVFPALDRGELVTIEIVDEQII